MNRETDPVRRVSDWLERHYRGLVEPVTRLPIADGLGLWVYGCRARPVTGFPGRPMLTSLVAVPKNGTEPFHPATDDPWEDMAAFDRDPRPREVGAQAGV